MLLIWVLPIWFGLALWSSLSGWLSRFDAALVMAFGFVLPWGGYLALFHFSNRFRRFVYTRNLKLMTLLEAGRILGGIPFGVAVWQETMPPGFALVTFVTDEVVGFTAFAAAFILLDRYPRWFTIWHVVGLGVLVLSGTLGILAAPSVGIVGGPLTSQGMTRLPFSLVPTFFAPIVQVAHFIALTQMWQPESEKRLGVGRGPG